jgi:hypothetical protein
MVWASVYAAWRLPKSSSVSNMFNDWLNLVPQNVKPLVFVGAGALCWAVWRCRNAVVFDNESPNFLQVIFTTSHWLRIWSILQQPSSRDSLVAASQCLVQVAKAIFARAFGWQSSLRIGGS